MDVVSEQRQVLRDSDVLGHLRVEERSLAVLEEHRCQSLPQTYISQTNGLVESEGDNN